MNSVGIGEGVPPSITQVEEPKITPLQVLKTRHRGYLQSSKDQSWVTGTSTVSNYEFYFADVLEGEKILDTVHGKQDVVVIDLMAESGMLSDLFSQLPEGTKTQGIAVSFEDPPSEQQKTSLALQGITQLTGDITSSETWKELTKALNGQKANLIIERALGGLSYTPHHAGLLSVLLQRAYGLLSEGGAMLIEIPLDHPFYKDSLFPVSKWVEYAQEKGVNVRQGKNTGALYIRKAPGAPEHLPFPNKRNFRPLSKFS